MGVADLYTILAGGAWVAKEGISEAVRYANGYDRARYNAAYTNTHTDEELELRMTKDVENPAKYEEIWRRIEEFKRDNPAWCFIDIRKSTRKKYMEPGVTISSPWYKIVGKFRPDFFAPFGGIYGKTRRQTDYLESNRKLAVTLLMQTYWKKTIWYAWHKPIFESFTTAKSKRK